MVKRLKVCFGVDKYLPITVILSWWNSLQNLEPVGIVMDTQVLYVCL